MPKEKTVTFLIENTADTIAQFNPPVCHKCQADLTQPRSISRLYVAKSEGLEDSHCLGHYDAQTGYFEPDSSPSVPLEHHDLLDNSDECQSCGAVVG